MISIDVTKNLNYTYYLDLQKTKCINYYQISISLDISCNFKGLLINILNNSFIMKKAHLLVSIIITVFFTNLISAQQPPDSSINLALSNDATVSGQATNDSRGTPLDILYNPSTGNYETSAYFSEYGIGYRENIGKPTVGNGLNWQVDWTTAKSINYITFGGVYSPGQEQSNTNWRISYLDGSNWIIIEQGTGGWIDSGIYVWDNTSELPITANALKLELYSDGINDIVSTHLRGRGGNSYIDDSANPIKATLIQLLPFDNQAPTASTLSSTAQTDTSVSLSWTAATDDTAVTGYNIFKDGNLETTLGSVQNYMVTGLSANTTFNFTITAVDAAGNESVASNTLAITTDLSNDNQAPTASTLSSSAQTNTSVSLSWTAATDDTGVAGYNIFKDGNLETTLGNVQNYMVTGLSANTTYNFTITAVDAAGNESVASNTLVITTDLSNDNQAPSASTLSSTAQTDTSVSLSWTAATDDTAVTGYNIFKDGNLETTLGNVQNYMVTGLSANTTYNFTITAVDAAGNESVASNTLAITTNISNDNQAPTASTLSSTAQTNTSVSLSWTAATDDTAVTGYNIFKDGNLETTLGNVQNYMVTGLSANTTYNFTITAVDAAGNESVASNTLAITTNISNDNQAPTASTLSSTAQTNTSVSLSWTAATDDTAVTGYNIFKDGNLETTLGSVQNYMVTGLSANTTYNFTITVLDAAGNASVASNTLAITTNSAPGGGSNWSLIDNNIFYDAGSVGIGTTDFTQNNSDSLLIINGKILCEEVEVIQDVAPDYVFEKYYTGFSLLKANYIMPTLEEVEAYTKENYHLPDVPSAAQMKAEGMQLKEMTTVLLQKVEELTLYTIEQEKRIKALEELIAKKQ